MTKCFWLLVPLVCLVCSCTRSEPMESSDPPQLREASAEAVAPDEDESPEDLAPSAPAPEPEPEPLPELESTPEPSVTVAPSAAEASSGDGSAMEEALAALQIPPPWLAGVEVDYDTSKPWGDARQEIRRLLGLRGEHNRQAIQLTCLYREKDDIGDGHEYPMYLFLGGEHAWSLVAYQEFTEKVLADPKTGEHIHAFLSLASNYSHFGAYDEALEAIDTAETRLPGPPWRIFQMANIEDARGDVHADMGEVDLAKQHYEESARLYPTAKPPYGGHLLVRQAAKVRSKIELLDRAALESATLRDGTYKAQTLGYAEALYVTLVVRDGRIDDVSVQHQEKIDQGATTIIPAQIVERQSLDVDAITGATVTVGAIVDGTLQALKKAGLD